VFNNCEVYVETGFLCDNRHAISLVICKYLQSHNKKKQQYTSNMTSMLLEWYVLCCIVPNDSRLYCVPHLYPIICTFTLVVLTGELVGVGLVCLCVCVLCFLNLFVIRVSQYGYYVLFDCQCSGGKSQDTVLS